MDFGVLHLFSGIGGAALGMQDAEDEFRGIRGRFITLAGIDCDPEACADFEMLTGAPAVQMDLFRREDYRAFHGHEPPEGWREVTAADIRAATGGIAPDVIFTSPPCKGFSGLLPSKSARSQKYQALNRLTVRGLELSLKAYANDLPGIILLENVPRITSRGADLLNEIKALLGAHGYLFHEGYHDCGEIGGLGQRRRRYLLIARHQAKVGAFVYQPPALRVRPLGQIIGPLPLPDDPRGGKMHKLPRLQWKTWVRLALIPAGGDWRDLEDVKSEDYYLKQVNGPKIKAPDPRLPKRSNRHPSIYQVVRFDQPGPCVTGTRFGSGAPAVADPRTGFKPSTHRAIYRVRQWDKPSGTVTGAMGPNNGAISIQDPRLGCRCRSGSYGVQRWDAPGNTVTTADIHAGPAAVADPRIRGDREQGTWVIIALDGAWHRPLTTWELLALQGFPVYMPDGSPVVLAGGSNARWRERIGNAVPPPAAMAIGETILRALLPSVQGVWVMGSTDIWVREEMGLVYKG